MMYIPAMKSEIPITNIPTTKLAIPSGEPPKSINP